MECHESVGDLCLPLKECAQGDVKVSIEDLVSFRSNFDREHFSIISTEDMELLLQANV